RLLALTNRDLRAEVAAGRFRRDLYYRISATRLVVPPLRAREGDIERLAAHFSETLAARHRVPERRLSPAALQILRGYGWPGNVRELRNVFEGLLLAADGTEVDAEEARAALPLAEDPPAPAVTLGTGLEAVEQAAIARAVADAGGNIALAARALGVSRSTLYRKAKYFGIRI
ncbi:MAG: helix-turn-helix domain-containing protein, partial [Acetobacteraceae bacterium]